jgi:hypothetical protein
MMMQINLAISTTLQPYLAVISTPGKDIVNGAQIVDSLMELHTHRKDIVNGAHIVGATMGLQTHIPPAHPNQFRQHQSILTTHVMVLQLQASLIINRLTLSVNQS